MKEDNELIAEFMGEEISAVIANYGQPVRVLVLPRKPISETKSGRPIEVMYQTSWDWLMPVVEKITPLSKQVGQQAWFDTGYFLLDGNIKVVYERTVQFIKWHNQTPHP